MPKLKDQMEALEMMGDTMPRMPRTSKRGKKGKKPAGKGKAAEREMGHTPTKCKGKS